MRRVQYDVETPEAYLEALEDDWRREKLLELREMIKEFGPHLVEGIDYKMLSYRDGEEILFGLNAQKHYVSLYVGDIKKIDPDGALLQGLNLGKGCIRFSKSKAIGATRIAEFIQRAVEMSKRGEDLNC